MSSRAPESALVAAKVPPETGSVEEEPDAVVLDQWVTPDIADNRGVLLAGQALEWMDVAATLAASRYCRTRVLTVSIDGVNLRHPLRVGSALRMMAHVAHTSARGLGVSVRALTHDQTVMTAFITFVSVDHMGDVLPVTALPDQNGDAPVGSTESSAACRAGESYRELRRRLLAGAVPQLPERWTRHKPKKAWARIFHEVQQMPGAISRAFLRMRNHTQSDRRRQSYVHAVEPVRVHELNFQHTLYGGTIVRWLGRSAEQSARRWLGQEPVRLIAIHGLTYLRPARSNHCVHVHSMVVHTGEHSVTTLVEVYAEDPVGGDAFQAVRAFMSYAPLRDCEIPSIDCIDDGERALYAEVVQHLEMQSLIGTVESVNASY